MMKSTSNNSQQAQARPFFPRGVSFFSARADQHSSNRLKKDILDCRNWSDDLSAQGTQRAPVIGVHHRDFIKQAEDSGREGVRGTREL